MALKKHMVTCYGGKPEVRLRGAWLEDLGFDVGYLLVVKASKGRIVLREPTEEEWVDIEAKQAWREAVDAERVARHKRAHAQAVAARFT